MNAMETEALRAFYVGTRQQLYTYAVSITGNRESAEDAIHGVFEQLLRQGYMPGDLRPYIFRCVRNAALDDLRRTSSPVLLAPDDTRQLRVSSAYIACLFYESSALPLNYPDEPRASGNALQVSRFAGKG